MEQQSRPDSYLPGTKAKGIHSCTYNETRGLQEALRVTDVVLRREPGGLKEVRLSTSVQVDKRGVLRGYLVGGTYVP